MTHGAFILTTPTSPAVRFGGEWTEQKLSILEKYLNAYTTALKDQPFRLMYIDAFAGTGWIATGATAPYRSLFRAEEREFVKGSVLRALDVRDKRFDRCIFLDRDPEYCRGLEQIRGRHPGREIEIHNTDANSFLREYRFHRAGWRGVLFLDPFATEVEWATIERIAELEMLDAWILFPAGTLGRMLPTSRKPEDVDAAWKARLNTVFGSNRWERLYERETRSSLFGGSLSRFVREPGEEGLTTIYKENLRDLFRERFLDRSAPLTNSRGRVLYDFMFCAGHPRGARIAKNIAGHLLKISRDLS